jgi:hypothetical protein
MGSRNVNTKIPLEEVIKLPEIPNGIQEEKYWEFRKKILGFNYIHIAQVGSRNIQ